jgi:hypothetical protein
MQSFYGDVRGQAIAPLVLSGRNVPILHSVSLAPRIDGGVWLH